MDGKALSDEAKSFGLALTRTQLEAFALYEKRLYEANRAANLTRVPLTECWSRHFLDSLILSPLVPQGATVLDIGSGAGFPGACLAIARPDLTVTCMDSGSKAVLFLRDLFGPGGLLSVLYNVVQGRAEDAALEKRLRESFDFVTGRALAPLPVQAEVSAAFVKVGGLFVPMRTPKDRGVVNFGANRLGLQLIEMKSLRVNPIGAVRFLPVFKKQGRTPTEYPRSWARIKSKPLSS